MSVEDIQRLKESSKGKKKDSIMFILYFDFESCSVTQSSDAHDLKFEYTTTDDAHTTTNTTVYHCLP